jgi:hypothetical protein
VRVLAIVPNPQDATAWYRVISPLRTLSTQVPSLKIGVKQGVNAPDWELALWEVVFFQRPATPEALACIERAKLLGCKVWIDYDDDGKPYACTENPAGFIGDSLDDLEAAFARARRSLGEAVLDYASLGRA